MITPFLQFIMEEEDYEFTKFHKQAKKKLDNCTILHIAHNVYKIQMYFTL